MATPVMRTRKNKRGQYEHYVEGRHLNFRRLVGIAEEAGLYDTFLSIKSDIPTYPQPVFQVSHLKYDTDFDGLKGIKEKGGFMGPCGGDGLVWFNPKVVPRKIKDAEKEPVWITKPDWTEDRVQIEQGSLENFASSPVFQRESSYGSYRFTFSVWQVLKAYKKQFCEDQDPILRVMETVLCEQEVTYTVLVHSPANEDQFSKYPPLVEREHGEPIVDKRDPVCTYRGGHFMWRSQGMCGTHCFKLVQNDDDQTMKAEEIKGPDELLDSASNWFVWDHVAIALHVGDKLLKFDSPTLRDKLTYCKKRVIRGDPDINFQSYETAERKVQKLWPEYQIPLVREGQKRTVGPQGNQDPEEEEDDLTEG